MQPGFIRFFLILVAILIVLALCLCASLGCSRKFDSPWFIRNPYLQAVTDNSAIIMWEFGSASKAVVSLIGPGVEKETAGGPGNSSGGLCIASFTGLAPSTEYSYTIRQGIYRVGPYSFRTAPPASAGFRMCVYGDSRTNPGEHAKVVGEIIKAGPQFVIHTGDLGTYSHGPATWDYEFFAPAARLIRSVPLYPVHGNHENYAKEFCESFRAPERDWAKPDGAGRPKLYYTFTWGCARFVVLDSLDIDSAEQMDFLNSSLALAGRDWLFVAMHHPLTLAEHGSPLWDRSRKNTGAFSRPRCAH